jgi:hypothetical protein
MSGSAVLSLSSGCPFDGVPIRRNPDRDHIASPQLAIDGEFEQRQATDLLFDLQPGSDRPNAVFLLTRALFV